jgi:hypothetical protein
LRVKTPAHHVKKKRRRRITNYFQTGFQEKRKTVILIHIPVVFLTKPPHRGLNGQLVLVARADAFSRQAGSLSNGPPAKILSIRGRFAPGQIFVARGLAACAIVPAAG